MNQNSIRYVGVNDHDIDLFEGQYAVKNGMAYNSYIVMDEKIAVMDTVDARFTGEWLANLACELDGRKPDYLIVQHMEPDHSASIASFMDAYPETVIVASQKAFAMMSQFYGREYADRRIVAGEGTTLDLGGRTLSFITAPMVHWPEVLMTYDAQNGVLFSADAFGKFGALDVEEAWLDEARRYYIGIVGKFGAQVQTVLKKAAALDIRAICPLHGPALTENPGYYLEKYQTWSTYQPEEKGVTIACASIYGHTMEAAQLLADELRARGVAVALYDLARCDMAQAVADAFRYDRLVLAASSYNGGVFPFMKTFIDHLTERGYQNRTVALMENGSWAPTAARTMLKHLEAAKNLTMLSTVTIRSALNEQSENAVKALAGELNV